MLFNLCNAFEDICEVMIGPQNFEGNFESLTKKKSGFGRLILPDHFYDKLVLIDKQSVDEIVLPSPAHDRLFSFMHFHFFQISVLLAPLGFHILGVLLKLIQPLAD